MNKIFEWLKESNRIQHLGLGYLIGWGADDCYCAIYVGLGVAGALEFKDYQWGGKPDIIDFVLTFAGVMFGYLTRFLIFKG